MRWLYVVLLLGACGDEPGLELFVDLRTDFAPGSDFVLVSTEWSRTPFDAPDASAEGTEREPATAADDFIEGVRVAELDGLAAGTVYLRLRLIDAAGSVVTSQRAIVALREDLVVTLVVTRSCLGVVCGSGQVCQGGTCVDERCGPTSPELCGDPQCTSSAECAASFECGSTACVEGACFEMPSDALCAAGERCDPSAGCVAVGTDAGPPDGGPPPPVDAGPVWPCAEVERIAGPDRYATAVAFSQRFFPSGATRVVLAANTAADTLTADGVIAPPLARRFGAPLLLTDGLSLRASTSAEIDRLDPDYAYLIGGTTAISADVESSLSARGITVVRYAGANRAATAAAVAEAVGPSRGRVLVVDGYDADLVNALVAAGAGAALEMPVLFVQNDLVPTATEAFIRDRGVSEIYVVGGTEGVSAAAAAALGALAPVTRVAGTAPAETAEAVAARFSGEVPANEVLIAHESLHTDGMAGAAAAHTYVLFAGDAMLADPTRTFLETSAMRAFVIGGTGVLPVAIEQQACEALVRR